VIWTSTSARAVRDTGGQVLYYEGFVQDITERKQIENAECEQRALAEALRHTAETLSSTLDHGEVLDQILVTVGNVVPSDAATIMLIQEGKAHVARSRGYKERGLDAKIMEFELSLVETANLWQMLMTAKPLIVPDVDSFPNWQKIPSVDWIRSNVGAPISFQGEVIGFILLDSETPGFFTPRHAERLEAFANQAALAIHNSRLMKQAQEEIAARKRTEDALRESEERFRLIAHNAEDMIWIMDMKLQLTYVSPAVEQALGYSAAEIVSSTPKRFVMPASYTMGLKAFAEEIENFQVLPDPNYCRLLEMEYRRRDGSTFWVEMKFSFFRDGNGYPVAVLGVGRDITARKQVEARVQDLLEFNEKILNHSPLGIITYKVTGECISANENSASILGATVEQLKLQNFYTIPSWRESGLYDLARRTISIHSAVSDDIHLKSTFGKDVWLRAHFVPFKSKDEDHVLLTIYDITDRRLAEGKLRESEERYRALFENSPISIWEEDFSQVKQHIDSLKQQGITDFRSYFASHPAVVVECNKMIGVLDVNQAGLQMYGAKSKRELIENTIQTLCQAEYDHNAEDFIAIAEGRTSNGWEGEDETMAGEPLEINLQWSVAPGHEQDFSKVIVTIIDITERKRTEQDLHASEERFRQMANNIEEVFWMTDVQTGRELYLSPASEKIWGRTSEEMMREPGVYINSIFPKDLPVVLYNLERQKHGEKTEMEYRIVRPDGSVRWIWDRAFPVFDEDGSIKVLTGIAADITDHKQAADALRESEERFSNAFEFAPIGKALVSLDGLCFKANRALCDLLGYTEQELAATPFQEFTHPEDLIAEINHVNQLLRGDIVFYQMEKRYCHKSGRIVWALLSVSLVKARDGKPSYFVAQVQDITERKNAEKEIKRHLSELEALYENGLAVGRYLEPHQIGERVIETFARHLSWHHVAIRLLNPGTNELSLIAFNQPGLQNTDRQETERRLRSAISHVGQGLSGWVVQTGEPVRSGNVQEYAQYVVTYPGIRSGLYMPLLAGDQVIGVISVESEEPDALSAQDERLLATLANQAAIAFENARLYQAAQQEINERKLIEEELRESQDRYRLLIETSPDGIVMMNMDGTIRFSNHQMAGLFNFETSIELFGASFISLFSPEEQIHIEELVDKHLFDDPVEEGHWFIRKDGTRFFGELRSSTLRNEKGEQYAIIALLRDATERKQSQEALREERQRFQDLFENSPIPTWLEDFNAVLAWMEDLRTQGITNLREYLEVHSDARKFGVGLIRILNVNHAAVIVNGARNKQELIDRIHGILMNDMASSFIIHEFDMIWQGITSFGFELTSQRMDGSLVTGIQRLYIPISNSQPDYGRVIVTSTDITERVEIERKLRASELHYRILADSITDVLFELDHDLRFTHWNKASEELMGIPAREAIGRSMYDLFGEAEEQIRIAKIYQSVLEKNLARTFETEIVIKGQKLVFEINANPSTRGVSVVARNITERKLSETLMQKRFELMDYSARHSFDDVLQRTIDIASELTGSHIGFLHFIEEDQATIKLQMWSGEMARDPNHAGTRGMHYPLERAGVWADAARYRQPIIHNNYAALPHRKGTPEGHVKVLREMVIPIIRNDRVLALMGVGNKTQEYTRQDVELAERFADYAWDITERKQMESALAEEHNQLARRVEERTADLSRANSNLARALRVKDEFLANMSHELRTPLNAILGLSESLGEQVAGPLNEKQQKYLSTINESGHHLLSLINDILDLAKIEAGQITLDINRVDVNSVCQASLRMIKQLAQKKSQEVVFEIDPDLGLIQADERRLKQMIVNLLSNAVKFTPEFSRIGLEARGDRAANRVIITVWDTGIGIKEEDLKRLFKPFVQLDSGLAREATGTGLGLALVAEMARLHGGSVTASSHPGQGSRFVVQLPWEPAVAEDMVTLLKNTGKFRAIDPGVNRPTILLIEDTREVVMMLVDYLEMAGYKMVTAQDGVDGLVQAKLTHPDLILLDIQMPRMDGFEATQRLRGDSELKDIPIVALTALAMPNDRQRCLDAGMDEYISKPVNLRALAKTIQKLLLRGARPV
jgi:PAS domain S-box-containing protein